MISALQKLKPIQDYIMFQFVEDTSRNNFHTKTKFGTIVMESQPKQITHPRWGKVIKVGKNTSSEIKPGMYILVSELRWTTRQKFENEYFWNTKESEVLAVSDELPFEY